MPATLSASILQFGEFQLDCGRFELFRNGRFLRVERKPMELLVLLASRKGEIVTRAEIAKRLWSSEVFVDTEHGINTAIGKLRHVLRDDADRPRFIQTVTGMGYRFVAPISMVAPSSATVPVQPAEVMPKDDPENPAYIQTVTGKGYRFIATVTDDPPANAAPVISQPVVPLPSGGRVPADAPRLGDAAPFEPRRPGISWKWIFSVAALVVIAAGAYRLHAHRPAPLTEKDTIVLADFTNSTGDAVFDATLRQGLEIQLQQSPFLSLVPEQRIHETVKLMAQPADARLTPAIAREVCVRTASAAVLDGSIAALGSQYVLGLRATDCRTGKLIGDEQAQATRKEDVLATLDSMTSKLRAKLGESLTTVARYDVPLAEATTSSLEALQAYSLGEQKFNAGDTNGSLLYFQRATELDPDFAMAYEAMACGCVSPQPEKARAYMTKAYSLRQRVSERERLQIEGDYFLFAEGDFDKAIAAHQLMAQIYPRDGQANASLSLDYRFLGDWERALPYAQTGIRLAPETAWIYDNLAYVYMSLGRLDDAAAIIRQGYERKLEYIDMPIEVYSLAFLQGDAKKMEETAASSIGKPGLDYRILYYQALTEQWHGHMRSARELIRQSVSTALNYDTREKAAAFTADASLFEAAVGDFGQGQAGAQTAMKILPSRDVRKVDAVTLAFTGDIAGAEKLAAQEERDEFDTRARRFWLPAARAEIALQRHDPGGALSILQAADTLDRTSPTMLPVFLRGQARLMQHDGAGAVAEFHQYIDHRGVVRNSPWGALARLELARAYSMQGDTAKARAEYQEFLTFWKDADPELAPLKQAKAEYAALH